MASARSAKVTSLCMDIQSASLITTGLTARLLARKASSLWNDEELSLQPWRMTRGSGMSGCSGQWGWCCVPGAWRLKGDCTAVSSRWPGDSLSWRCRYGTAHSPVLIDVGRAAGKCAGRRGAAVAVAVLAESHLYLTDRPRTEGAGQESATR